MPCPGSALARVSATESAVLGTVYRFDVTLYPLISACHEDPESGEPRIKGFIHSESTSIVTGDF